MSQKFIVTAVDRSAKGLHHVHRAGRAWPSAQEVVVEVLDQDACPMVAADKPGYPALPDPNKLGRIAWAAVMADGRLSKRPYGTAPDASEVDALKAKIAELEGDLELSKAGEYNKAGEIAALREKLDQSEAKIAELTALLESATASKPEVDSGQSSLPMTDSTKPKSKAVK